MTCETRDSLLRSSYLNLDLAVIMLTTELNVCVQTCRLLNLTCTLSVSVVKADDVTSGIELVIIHGNYFISLYSGVSEQGKKGQWLLPQLLGCCRLLLAVFVNVTTQP